MKTVKVHLMDLVRRHDAKSATWEYVEDTDHTTKGVMCWVVTLHKALISNGGFTKLRVEAHTIKLANGAELITDEYVAHLVNQRLEQA